MFEGFARVWTPLVPLRSLAAGPVSVPLAGGCASKAASA